MVEAILSELVETPRIHPRAIADLSRSKSKITTTFESLQRDPNYPDLAHTADSVVIALFDPLFFSWMGDLENRTNEAAKAQYNSCLDFENSIYLLSVLGTLVTVKTGYTNIARPERKESKRRTIQRVSHFDIYTVDLPRQYQFGDLASAREVSKDFHKYLGSKDLAALKDIAKKRIEDEVEEGLYRRPNLPRKMNRYFFREK